MLSSGEEDWERRVDEWGEKFGRRAEEWGQQFEKRIEDECFGLPYGGAIAGLLIGTIIVVIGLFLLPGFIPPEMREVGEPYFWGIALIVVGVLIVAGAMSRYRH